MHRSYINHTRILQKSHTAVDQKSDTIGKTMPGINHTKSRKTILLTNHIPKQDRTNAPKGVGWTVTGPSLAGGLYSLGFC